MCRESLDVGGAERERDANVDARPRGARRDDDGAEDDVHGRAVVEGDRERVDDRGGGVRVDARGARDERGLDEGFSRGERDFRRRRRECAR